MEFTVDTWFESNHANSNHGYNANTYCASCHSPFEGLATGERLPVLEEDWQNITCAACHPPHDLRVEWGTPVATYDVGTETYTPVYEGDNNEFDSICLTCHTGSRHSREFAGFGQSMAEHKGVTCVDCHMAAVPNPLEDGRLTRSHTFEVTENLPNSCINSGCHSNKTETWALKQIEKGKIHGKLKTNNGGGND
jgi:hypothetical protein